MKITIVMLESLNGKIAKSNNDDLLWGGKADKKHFFQITKDIGTMIYGSTTFDATGQRVLPGRKTYIMTRDPQRYAHITDPNVSFTSESPRELVARLESEGLEHIAVTGGGLISAMFLQEGLVDDMYISIAPVIFTEGADIFAENIKLDLELQLQEISNLDENTILIHYTVKK